ncbi:MAG: hypothetical protein H6Q67_1490 [Firmicutes bacterium]|nr:hypothetical protein [Bacillota bacterium]
MGLELNSKVMGSVVEELTRAVSRTGRSFYDITNYLSTIYPEILFTSDDWDQLPYRVKDGIISRIISSLETLS